MAADWPSTVTETLLRVVVAKPLMMLNCAGIAGPILEPKIVIISPGLTGPDTKLAAFRIPRMVGVLPTTTGRVPEFPPGAGLLTRICKVVATVNRLAGITACMIVELSLYTVVTKGKATPCTSASEAL